MGKLIPVALPVRGPLNTSDPKSDRVPGTLLEAYDLAHRWWGPRKGRQEVTWPGSKTRGPVSPAQLIQFQSGDYVTGQIFSFDQDIKDKFTLDIVLRWLGDPTSAAEIFQWRTGSAADLIVRHHTTGDLGRVQVFFNGVSGGEDLTSSTGLVDGTGDDTKIYHIRIYRDDDEAEIFINGISEDTASGLTSSKITWTSAPNTRETWRIGGSTGTLQGVEIYRLALRKNVYTDSDEGLVDLQYPRSSDIALAVACADDNGFVRDYSRWRSHGVVTGSPTTVSYVGWPHVHPVQGMASWRDREGVMQDVVLCGGNLAVRPRE